MDLSQATEYAEHPDKVIDPGACNFAQSIISGYITMEEENEFALRLEVDKQEDVLFGEHGTNATAARKIKLTPTYIEWQKSKRELARLKRLRRTLADRFTVLTQTKRF
jgi:hypothetical protein